MSHKSQVILSWLLSLFFMTARSYCFTINNPTVQDCDLIHSSCDGILNLVAVLERGDQGTLHYQGWVQLKKPQRMSWVKNAMPRAHIEKMHGPKRKAIRYCLKTLLETGSLTIPENSMSLKAWSFCTEIPQLLWLASEESGTTSLHCRDFWSSMISSTVANSQKKILLEMKKLIDQGKSESELAEFDFPVYVKNYRGLLRYRFLKSKPRDHEMNVIVIQGPTGTGKSRWARDCFPDAYWKQRSTWWDGYEGQETVIIDEFYGWLPFDLLLRICDRYPLYVETKGGNVNFVAKNIVIISNNIPSSWYKSDKVYWPSFVRRVSNWFVFKSMDEHLEFTSYEDFSLNMINTNIFN